MEVSDKAANMIKDILEKEGADISAQIRIMPTTSD